LHIPAATALYASPPSPRYPLSSPLTPPLSSPLLSSPTPPNRFGHGSAKLARQAQSKEKTLAKMVDSGLTERVEADKVITIRFEPCGKLPPPVLQFTQVTFGKYIFIC
jgi:hypothetical protein